MSTRTAESADPEEFERMVDKFYHELKDVSCVLINTLIFGSTESPQTVSAQDC